MVTIFDHLKNITYDKGPYLGDEGWNIYMINRYLSMDEDYCELVNAVQKNFRWNSFIPNEVIYESYKNIIPQEKKFLRYIKNQNKSKYNELQLEAVAMYFEVSQKEARDYIDMLPKADVKEIMQQLNLKK
jgi:hypothetical protein